VMGFDVSLADKHFEALSQAALGIGEEYSILFSASRVSGFYSDWSPSISTDCVKVLTAFPEQRVELPPNIKDVPRLGEVGEFKLAIARRASLSAWNSRLLEDESHEAKIKPRPVEDAPDRPHEGEENTSLLLPEIRRLQHAIGALRLPLWLLLLVAIAALLLHK
jgi:hypothetical protein